METLHAGIRDLARNAARMGTAHLLVVDERVGRAKICPISDWVPTGLPVPPDLQKRIAADVTNEYPAVIFVATVGPRVFSVYKTPGDPSAAAPPPCSDTERTKGASATSAPLAGGERGVDASPTGADRDGETN